MKTVPTELSVADYFTAIADETRRTDCQTLVTLIGSVTQEPPVLWGTSIIGFGAYHYKYASGHEGDTMKIGLASRKEHFVLYGVIAYDHNTELLEQLGKCKHGKGCLYLKKLADVNLDVLRQMVGYAYDHHAPSAASNTARVD